MGEGQGVTHNSPPGTLGGACQLSPRGRAHGPGLSPPPAQQVLSEVTEDNLIDLGPGSPAVVSPTVGGTVPPSSLSSQLAGLGECPGTASRPPPAPRQPCGGPVGQRVPESCCAISAEGLFPKLRV